ncbi:type VII secretion protein EccCb [Streptomyces sp. NPDC059524]|uniref:type VII secretion protein EccCb n=1 Tax=Streptomyces sp. NPDC059524 TaxID=3346856 RepID=UPI00367E96AB
MLYVLVRAFSVPLPGLDRAALREATPGLGAPIGLSDIGRPLVLDPIGPGHGGTGPHGLLVGAAGSGKSELLRTLVLSLALHHAPENLNFLLVPTGDELTFAGLTALPHVSATVGLDPDLTEPAALERVMEALRGELARRQDLVNRGVDLHDNRPALEKGPEPAKLPRLVVVIEDFSGLVEAKPDLMDLLVHIGRVGRTLGVHLLLGARRLGENTLRGIGPFLSYRLALRTATAEESRAVIGVPDANRLPRDPGVGYLQTGSDVLQRFTTAYVSAPHRSGPESVLDVVAGSLTDDGPRARPVILPPLEEPPALDTLLDSPGELSHGSLRVPLGLTDKPYEQRRAPFVLGFAARDGGHAMVVGRPGTGKTTLLATLVCAFALTHAPTETQFYVLDLDGGLAGLAGLPHVGGVAGRADRDKVRRTVAEVSGILARREKWATSAKGPDRDPDDPWGEVFLLVDGMATLRAEFESLEPEMETLARHGRMFGVHLVVTATRHPDVRPVLHDQFEHLVELRLSDPAESRIDRTRAAMVPRNAPGHALTQSRDLVLTALPRPHDSTAEAPEALAELVAAAQERWTGHPPAPRLRMLPQLLTPAELPPREGTPGEVVRIGLGETSLDPMDVDFATSPFFLVMGEPGSGKSSFLRMVGRRITEQLGNRQAQLLVADYRRALLGEFPDHIRAGYATSGPELASMAAQLAGALSERIPGPEVTTRQLKERSWYTGAHAYLLVDDYDLVALPSGNPLQPLIELLPYAREVGLRVVLTRNASGAARSLYEPFLQRVRELAPMGIVLSGDRSEGALLGSARPRREPPGRGTLVDPKHGERRIQLAYEPPQATDPIERGAPGS